jgi:hypothetical protein
MYSSKWKLMILAILALIVIGGTVGCWGSNAECKVTYDAREDSFEIIVNPPGETGEFTQFNPDGSYKRKTHVSKEPGQDAVAITEYEINLVRTYNESRNTYEIQGKIEFDDRGDKSKLTSYTLTITGGVYGDASFQCTK